MGHVTTDTHPTHPTANLQHLLWQTPIEESKFRRELDPRFMWERLIEVWVFFHVHAEFRLMYVCWNAGLSIGAMSTGQLRRAFSTN